jgi:hypothetical protein
MASATLAGKDKSVEKRCQGQLETATSIGLHRVREPLISGLPDIYLVKGVQAKTTFSAVVACRPLAAGSPAPCNRD